MQDLPGLECVAGDLSSREVVAGCVSRSDVVYHLAGLTRSRRKAELMAVNGDATGRLAGEARAGGCRLVYLSSLAAAGPCTSANAVAENCTASPVSTYGESKLQGERLLREKLGEKGWTIIRAPAVYGPRDKDVLFLFRLARRGIILQVRNAMGEVSVIHVSDLVRALILAGTSPAADGRIYHVSDGRVHHRDDIADAIRSAVGRGVPVPLPAILLRAVGLAGDLSGLLTGRTALLNSDKAEESVQCGWVCDDARIREELGFKAAISLEEGFRRTCDWYRETGWLRPG